MICTDHDCGEESGFLSLCEDHRAELKDLLDNVNFLIVNLDPNIQAGKVTKKPGGQEGGNGTRSAESKPPMRIDTNQIRYWLWEIKDLNAYIEARDNPKAGQTLHMARTWVSKARDAVYGPEEAEARRPEELQAKLAEEVPKALRTKPLIEWLQAKHGLTIKATLIRKWDQRGKITRNNHSGFPTYDPATVAIYAKQEKS